MPVTDFLERNVKLYGEETALVELNPELPDPRRITWKEYDQPLRQPPLVTSGQKGRQGGYFDV